MKSMDTQNRFSRRRILAVSGACAVAALSGSVAAADKLRRTPAQALGPFYPLDLPLDDDADLTLVKGRKTRATGQVIHVMGRVLNLAGEPVKGARIEVWQANAHGRYRHPNDSNPAPLDPNFEGFARLSTDAEGRYRFKTIKPSGYPAGQMMRPAHIHFDVAGKVSRLVTQMYFPGDPLIGNDGILAAAQQNKQLLIAEVRPPTRDLELDSLLANWDIVLENG
jgi:protocatechuate 3,4-dioxygenase, beta subunit